MKAVILTGYGGTERFQVRDVARPEPGSGQLLVRVRAAGVNPIDWKIRRGSLRWLLPASFPLILGFDVAGEVAAIGPEVSEYEPGDPVYAMLDSRHGGGYAEYAVAGQAAAAHMPPGLSYEEAAAVPLAALTALQALRDVADLGGGERVAVTGAAGGVGHFAVQLAAATGAHVTAVAGPGHRDFLRRLGAERTVDYTRQDFTLPEEIGDTEAELSPPDRTEDAEAQHTLPDRTGDTEGESILPDEIGDSEGGVDSTYAVIFDAAGSWSFASCEPALGRGGVYVTTRRGPAIFIAQLRAGLARLIDRDGARRAAPIVAHPSGADLAALAQLVDAGRLRPEISRIFALEQAGEAHAASEGGHTRGKLVLRIDP